jgi:hypothetical protein
MHAVRLNMQVRYTFDEGGSCSHDDVLRSSYLLVPRWWLAPPPVARKLATWGTPTECLSVERNFHVQRHFFPSAAIDPPFLPPQPRLNHATKAKTCSRVL